MDISQILILEKENLDSMIDLLEESGEEETTVDSYVKFIYNEKEFVANYVIKITGDYVYYKGDYWTPGYTELESVDWDITLDSLFIDDTIANVNPKTKLLLEDLAKKIID